MAQEEASEHLQRLAIIEEQEADRTRRRKLAEIESQTEFERLWRLKYTELYGGSILGTLNIADESLMGFNDEEIE